MRAVPVDGREEEVERAATRAPVFFPSAPRLSSLPEQHRHTRFSAGGAYARGRGSSPPPVDRERSRSASETKRGRAPRIGVASASSSGASPGRPDVLGAGAARRRCGAGLAGPVWEARDLPGGLTACIFGAWLGEAENEEPLSPLSLFSTPGLITYAASPLSPFFFLSLSLHGGTQQAPPPARMNPGGCVLPCKQVGRGMGDGEQTKDGHIKDKQSKKKAMGMAG